VDILKLKRLTWTGEKCALRSRDSLLKMWNLLRYATKIIGFRKVQIS